MYVLISEQFNGIISIHNNVFIMFVLHIVRQSLHPYVHPKRYNNEFIRLVIHIYWQFRHNNVHSKVLKSMFNFIRQISYTVYLLLYIPLVLRALDYTIFNRVVTSNLKYYKRKYNSTYINTHLHVIPVYLILQMGGEFVLFR